MAWRELVLQLVFNIGLLVIVANLFSQSHKLRDIIVQERRGWKSEMLLSVIFAGIIILSVCMGVDFEDYSINTRMIGAMSSGLIGGPIVGLFASMLGALFVLFSPGPQTFAMAAAFSTMIFGLLGGGFYPYFQRGKWKYRDLFVLACFAEIAEMVVLLRTTISLEVLETILQITLPVVLVNAVGILIFISVFNNVFIMQDIESSRQLQIASRLSQKAMPLLRKGLNRGDGMREMASVLLDATDWAGVMITNETSILAWQERGLDYQPESNKDIPSIAKEAMRTGEMVTMYQVPETSSWHEYMKEYSLVAVPFMIKDKAMGSLVVWMKKQWVFRQTELELLQNFVTIASFQIAAAELEAQTELRQKAEFKALQFQVNPHFLFNALNTISCVCREDSKRARELLITLADYFRYNLDYEAYLVPMEEELEHVKDYLKIEKARFEEKLIVTYDVPEEMDIQIPTLIMQPIVENAVRHGKDEQGRSIVHISITEEPDAYIVKVKDKGLGFDKDVLKKLENGEPIGSSIGLTNVHRRLKSIYGSEYGLKIDSSPIGSSVKMIFLKK